MKKFLLALVLLCSAVFAQVDDWDNYQWPRSYFASAGFSVIATRGDFFRGNLTLKNEETINMPTSKILVSPDYMLGVNIREFTLTAAFQYWSMNGSVDENPEDMREQHMRYWRFGIEFTYNFFYPDFFQAGLGLGYSFSSIKTKNSVFDEKGKYSDAELMGSGVALVGTMKYMITEHFGLRPILRINETWYKAVNTKAGGTQDLSDYIWETYITISVNALVQF